jgi:TetR/AcrR family transcriptional regulator, transcriptional repressor for nem operon
MRKGERTRTMVLEQAANLFNTKGYAASSLSEIMAATGLEKGGIYNHFESKEALGLEAFDFAVEKIMGRYQASLAGKTHSLERLKAVTEVFREMMHDPVVRGGCPVMNASIEADDANPALRDRVRRVFTQWRTIMLGILEKGISQGELRRDTNREQLATVMIATLEGAVMLSRVYRDPAHIERAVDFLVAHLETLRVEGA